MHGGQCLKAPCLQCRNALLSSFGSTGIARDVYAAVDRASRRTTCRLAAVLALLLTAARPQSQSKEYSWPAMHQVSPYQTPQAVVELEDAVSTFLDAASVRLLDRCSALITQ